MIALLRGINVGGHNKVPMAELRALFEQLGYTDVRTYIASGNVLFTPDVHVASMVQQRIEAAVAAAFGKNIAVIVRTDAELAAALRNNPFPAPTGEQRVSITFMSALPMASGLRDIAGIVDPRNDELRIIGREAYLLCRGGYGETVFSNQLLEKRLGVRATTRTLETVVKLVGLCR